MEEVWKDVVGYYGLYQVNNLGRIKTMSYGARKLSWIKFKINEKILSTRKNKCGYEYLNLYLDGKRKTCTIHRLVAIAFIQNPNSKPYINHIDGNKTNNNINNLEWCTDSENKIHSFHVLGHKSCNYGKFGKDNHSSIKVNQYTLEGEFIKTWGGMMEAKRGLGMKTMTGISSCCKGKYKTASGFIWKYT